MKCDPFFDLIELYAIGALETADSEAFRYHLESGCEECGSRLDKAVVQAAMISRTVPLVAPPAGLRDRIAASVNAANPVIVMPEPPPRKRGGGVAAWLIAAAAVLALVCGIAYEEIARKSEVASLSSALETANLQSLAEARRSEVEAKRMAQMLAILQAPGTTEVELNSTKADHTEGHLFIHAKLGVAMIMANLPNAPAGWKYESWIVPRTGEPRPIESFARNQAGIAVTIVGGPVDVAQWSGLAVSLEPDDSTPIKPTKIVFVNPV
jgi:hypothetical protein